MTGTKQAVYMVKSCMECFHYKMHIGQAYAYCERSMRNVTFRITKFAGTDTAIECTLDNYKLEDK